MKPILIKNFMKIKNGNVYVRNYYAETVDHLCTFYLLPWILHNYYTIIAIISPISMLITRLARNIKF